MGTKNLKFIHLGSNAVAKGQSFDAGSIIFEPKSGRIAVQGATTGDAGLEYYGGGRIADATFENKILTLSFNDGSKAITLDFSDTASAEGVNKILGVLRTDVNALKTTVGDAGSGLVKAVADNTANIATNAAAIKSNKGAIDAINNVDTGILAEAKKYTNGELTTLKNGYVGTLKDLDDNIKSNDTDISNLQGLHADGGNHNGKKSVAEEINEKVGTGIAGTVKDYVDGQVSNINSAAGTLAGRVTTLETTVNGNDNTVGLVKKVTDLQALHADKTDGTGKMTVQQEAAAEVAKIVAGAPASYDTLKEIADWITNDTTGAASMANDIAALKTSVGSSTDAAAADGSVYARIAKNKGDIAANAGKIATNATAIKANADAIDALEALHAPGKNVAAEVTDGITNIPEAIKSAGTDVKVTVKTKSGSVSEVAVDATVLDGKVTTEKERAEGVEAAIRKDLGTKDEREGDAFTRIKALEAAQSSGALMWSDWQD